MFVFHNMAPDHDNKMMHQIPIHKDFMQIMNMYYVHNIYNWRVIADSRKVVGSMYTVNKNEYRQPTGLFREGWRFDMYDNLPPTNQICRTHIRIFTTARTLNLVNPTIFTLILIFY